MVRSQLRLSQCFTFLLMLNSWSYRICLKERSSLVPSILKKIMNTTTNCTSLLSQVLHPIRRRRTSKFYQDDSLYITYPFPYGTETFNQKHWKPLTSFLEVCFFRNTESNISSKEKSVFIEFAKKMIRWCPQERYTAKELLKIPQLYTRSSRD